MLKWADDQKRIIYYEADRDWEWSDLLKATYDMQPMLDSAVQRVNIIINLCVGHSFAAEAFTLFREFAACPVIQHPNAGQIVVVATDPALQALMTVFVGTFPALAHRISSVPTVDEAWSIIRQVQPAR